jgi:hypothetical protein
VLIVRDSLVLRSTMPGTGGEPDRASAVLSAREAPPFEEGCELPPNTSTVAAPSEPSDNPTAEQRSLWIRSGGSEVHDVKAWSYTSADINHD